VSEAASIVAVTEPDDRPVRTASVGGQRVDRVLLAKSIAKAAEVSAAVLAVAYGLGMLVLAGQLRALGLHSTSTLTGFKHDDVLMKGFGAVLSHVPALVTLVVVVGMALNEQVRSFVRDTFAPAELRSAAGRRWSTGRVVAIRAAVGALLAVVLLTSVWWEGTLVMIGLFGYLIVAVRFRTLMAPNALLGAGLLGLLVIGAMSTYVHPTPPPDIHITTSDGRKVAGGLLGTGDRGEWYVVQYDHNASNGLDDGKLQLVPDKQVVDIRLDEPPASGSRLLYQLLLGR
jgi:hypothetical protein